MVEISVLAWARGASFPLVAGCAAIDPFSAAGEPHCTRQAHAVFSLLVSQFMIIIT